MLAAGRALLCRGVNRLASVAVGFLRPSAAPAPAPAGWKPAKRLRLVSSRVCLTLSSSVQ